MPRKISRKGLEKKLDDLCREIVRKRDNNICQKCDKSVDKSNNHWSHIVPVSQNKRMKWDPINSVVMCFHCHINWWHKRPLESGEWFKSKYPERYEYLQSIKNIIKPIKVTDLEEIYKKLKEKNEL